MSNDFGITHSVHWAIKHLYKLNKSLELIEELQSTSVTPYEIPRLLSLREITPKKTKAKRVTQVCGSM